MPLPTTATSKTLFVITAGLIPVARQRIAERHLEWCEPGLVVFPLIETVTKDRLAHLLGACGANAAFIPVEIDACGLEIESAEIEHPAHAAFEIVDDIPVIHAQNPVRKDR